MRLLVLTSGRFTTASRCLPALCRSRKVDVAAVVLAHGTSVNRRRQWWRKLKKALRIGPLGALNGVRIRAWYRDDEAEDIEYLAEEYKVPFFETPAINSERTIDIFRATEPDLGLSLGNGYIGQKIFSIPRHGMINIHGEILPEYQGAHSVIWPIYDGVAETGFTIHRIDDEIDTGDILYRERFPIRFRPTLRETVEASIEQLRPHVTPALVRVCEDFDDYVAKAQPQRRGRAYTTPTFWQFLRMLRNHRRMYGEAMRAAEGGGMAPERVGRGR